MTDPKNGPSPVPAEPCLADDLLRGADEIAEFMFNDRRLARRVYHIAATSKFPTFKLGAVLCARKSKLMHWIEEQEAASIGQGAA